MRVLIAYGTRPEQIKLAPIRDALRASGVEVREFETVQSPDLLQNAKPSEVSWKGGLSIGISSVLQNLRLSIQSWRPDILIVQGDTATAFSCALGGWLEGVFVAHVEAGLRTYAEEPWPEEIFRQMISVLAEWHFAPDQIAADNLAREGFENGVFIVGNPVIDTLPPARPQILVTLHRRENWGERIEGALDALQAVAGHATQPTIVVIRHPNWKRWLSDNEDERWPDLHIRDPLPPARFRSWLNLSDVVVTDSGGLQEEAAYFGKPCLVLRTSTERVALAENGAITLVDPDQPSALRAELRLLLDRRSAYGTGGTGERIANILLPELEALNA